MYMYAADICTRICSGHCNRKDVLARLYNKHVLPFELSIASYNGISDLDTLERL